MSWPRLWPRGLAGQLVLVLLLAMVAGQAAAFWLFADERRAALDTLRYQQIVDRLATVVRMVRAVPDDQQPALIAAAAGPELALRVVARPHAPPPRPPERWLARRIARAFDMAPEQVRVELRRPPGHGRWRDWSPPEGASPDEPPRRRWRVVGVAVQLGPGRWLEATLVPGPPPLGLGRLTLVAWLLTAGLLVLVVALSARRIVRPLRALGQAAERLGRGEPVPPLPEAGPDELRRTTRAFNEMQARLRRFIDDRTRMMAALGHDLRTPITALRLRAELVEEEEARERLLATLDEMHQMVEAALGFLRDEAASEPAREVDVAALVEGLCEDLRELGQEVHFTGPERLVARLRPTALKRALRNLIENAVAYGKRARVALAAGAGEITVTIEDDGPGIAQADLERVFEPFVRLEGSRSRETGGIGLGLAIARSVVCAHGGDIALANRPGGGLRATVRLPVAASA
jgi:signal transduction histidine kinase